MIRAKRRISSTSESPASSRTSRSDFCTRRPASEARACGCGVPLCLDWVCLLSHGACFPAGDSVGGRGGFPRPGRGCHAMAGVRVKDNEPIESAIRRFKKQCEKAGILAELRKREHYEKPSVRRKKKAMAARKRAMRRAARTPVVS